jgi:hypothetical protein
MIRREVQFADGSPQWLLISQVEHARLSGELVNRCLTKFGCLSQSINGNPALDQVREELLQAIIHHDDGWAEWEIAPRLNSESGKPLSFMELPLAEALEVWTASIDSAAQLGDLAPWVVSGHFSALLCTIGHHSQEPMARDWLRHIAEKRSLWFTQWRARHEALHTVALAGEALKWLQLFDILSLWPCSQYPVPGEIIRKHPEPFLNIDNWLLVREIHPRFELAGGEQARIVFNPWPFNEREIMITAEAHLVPVRKYQSSVELLSAYVPFTAKWTLAAR